MADGHSSADCRHALRLLHLLESLAPRLANPLRRGTCSRAQPQAANPDLAFRQRTSALWNLSQLSRLSFRAKRGICFSLLPPGDDFIKISTLLLRNLRNEN